MDPVNERLINELLQEVSAIRELLRRIADTLEVASMPAASFSVDDLSGTDYDGFTQIQLDD